MRVPHRDLTAASREVALDATPFSAAQLPDRDFGVREPSITESGLLRPRPRLAKTTFEWTLALVGGLLVLPTIVLIALLVKLTSRGPVFYKSRRVGWNGRPLWIWKFRTMVPEAEDALHEHIASNKELGKQWAERTKLRQDPRVTPIGRWLRRTSLDELPQIWNVLRGEMSLVGPRPLLPEDVPKYGKRLELYLQVLPGMSGLWQVSGRSNTTYARRVDLDCRYILNWSPLLDLSILLATVPVVLRGEGAF